RRSPAWRRVGEPGGARGAGVETGSGVGREVSWCAVTSLQAPGFRNGVGACYVTRAVVHSIVPLAVLEAVKNLDTPDEDGLSAFAEEFLYKRLGLSDTVALQ